jgi:dTDP-4-dehydrorhamnose 3,5-epimerase-like enzyme
MRIESNGVIYWKTLKQIDVRGEFKKIMADAQLGAFPAFHVHDFFLSNSQVNVIRGMHLQVNAFSSNRIIYVQEGKILDVLVDLKTQPKKPTIFSEYLGPEEEYDAIYVPSGIAHGYEVIKQTSVVYLADKEYSPFHDKGFRYNSIDFNWHTKKPILSERDLKLPEFKDFQL